jgi:hypothetical protein
MMCYNVPILVCSQKEISVAHENRTQQAADRSSTLDSAKEQIQSPGHSAASEAIRGGMEKPLLKNRAKMTENFVKGLAEARAGLVGGIGILMNTMKLNLEMTERERAALRDLTAPASSPIPRGALLLVPMLCVGTFF